jgi:hypothetical protein
MMLRSVFYEGEVSSTDCFSHDDVCTDSYPTLGQPMKKLCFENELSLGLRKKVVSFSDLPALTTATAMTLLRKRET